MSFDPDAFLNQTYTESNSTEFQPCPIGEYTLVALEAKVRQSAGKKDPSQTYTFLDITYSVEDDNVRRELDRSEVKVRQSLILELTEQGGLDFGKGKNVSLGRLREAMGLNAPGTPFSFASIPGRMVKGKIIHQVVNGAPVANVDMISKL